MPTIVLLDVSLSMLRPVPQAQGEEKLLRRSVAASAITHFLDVIGTNAKLEFCCLVVFSSLWELIVPFTRDFESIKAALFNIETYDKTCIETALDSVKSIVMDEWGAGVPCQAVLFTDGSTGIGSTSLKHRLANMSEAANFPLPYPFQCKIHVLCLGTSQEAAEPVPMFEKLVSINGAGGGVYVPESLTIKSVQQTITKLTNIHYQSFHGSLTCGNLNSQITLFPSPVNYDKVHDFTHVERQIASEINICGFMDMGDIGSPCAFTRHLVLPISPNTDEENSTQKDTSKIDTSDNNGSDEEMSTSSSDDGKIPNFCVLLHGSLKVEGMVAICEVGENWYGMLYSWADTRKKSNLMLSIFEPNDSIPWLGGFKELGPISGFETSPYLNDATPFPVKRVAEKRSYAQSCVVWIKQSGLQADIQKVLRHARKLPEKNQHFYRELNRVRRAALTFGFYQLLERMASILERECTQLPGTAHPEAAIQLSYAANALLSSQCLDIKHTIFPMRTSFGNDS